MTNYRGQELESLRGDDRRPMTDHLHRAVKARQSGIRKISGVKMLIATASLAATVGGWAQLAHHNSEVAGTSQTSQRPLSQVVVQSNQPALQLDALALPAIPPVPTVIPAPDFSNLALATGGASTQAAAQVPTIAPLPPTPIPPRPTAQPKSAPALRQVTVPQPAPRVVTRSSR